MKAPLAAVVLCAGKGTRMKSERAKVLHPLLGRPLAYYPIACALEAGATQIVVVVGHQSETVRRELEQQFPGQPLAFALQEAPKGTGDAVAAARSTLVAATGPVLVLYGDVPLLTPGTLGRLLAAFRAGGAPLAMVSCRPPDPAGYGRLVRGADGHVTHVVEERDASDAQRSLSEVNAGIYVADARFLWGAVETLTPHNAQGELYLTDLVAKAAKLGPVAVVEAPAEETAGVNDRAELADRAAVLRARINRRHLIAGVTLVQPETVSIDDGVEIGPETIIGPQVSISGACEIGSGVTIGQGSVLLHSTVGDGTEIKPYSMLEEAVVGPRCHVGPFARLRPGSVLDEGAHVGNFVETKKTHLKRGAKANHLSYLGDAEIGAGSNIGAGTITCNYDGVVKHQTVLGEGVFIGSDTQLVAPVRIGDGAFIGAGSTITEDVPANALALSRTPQSVKENWAERRRKVLSGIKKQ
jgi:bifunctional UDP-N-acetylglucosamine pyrophosphorylase/glucosamine-1-phosphate N-acetyltransferase